MNIQYIHSQQNQVGAIEKVKQYEHFMEISEDLMVSREITIPDSISKATLEDMDKAISNFKQGEVSSAIDFFDLKLDNKCKYIL